MITLKNVNKYFFRHKKNEIHVIDDTSLELGDKGLVALLGPSGCGKTTLLNAIGGLDKINSGEIFINGTKMPKVGNYRKDKLRVLNIGYIFQDYNLLDNMTVFDNVALSLKMIGFKNRADIKKRVDYILELVGMYRYRNKLAANLSGGQRQRVGIARALVKNPEVIIADEPTGNLDSKNTIEIMNIIKTISQDRLVILVTHEKDLAHFYASRIVNLVDGKVESDNINEHENELDYRIDNNIYLKDFKNNDKFGDDDNEINIYYDNKEKFHLDIVIKNGNIYIKTANDEKIEVVDRESGIEFIDDNYKTIKKDDYEKRKYDLDKLDIPREKMRYSSIYNILSMLKTGLAKVAGYTLMKKILLFGFFFSAMFIFYALGSIFGAITIKDDNFLNAHRDYIAIINRENDVEDYLKIEGMTGVKYAIPGTSQIIINLSNEILWQLNEQSYELAGSLASAGLLKKEDMMVGRLPSDKDEIVIDKKTIDIGEFKDPSVRWLNVHDYEDYVGLDVSVGNLEYKVVGVSDSSNPCIYFNESELIDVIANSGGNFYESSVGVSSGMVQNYERLKEHITLVEGRAPTNDYEVIVSEYNRYQLPLGKTVDYTVNGEKLTVVGYYSSNEVINEYIVSANTYKLSVVASKSNILLVAEDKEKTIEQLIKEGYNAVDNYNVLKEEYIQSVKENVIESLVLAGILLAISFIEIFLMIRASFLSRIKEVGIYRAIGVKKTDIYKMFLGEILVITTIGGLPGSILMASILREITKISFFSSMYVMNTGIVILGIIIVYLLNIIVGLLPIRSTIRKTPAEILSRNDVD